MAKGARTRQAVLDEAIAQFAAVGRRGASVATIARAVGLTPSAVYVYFPSKDALFEAAVDADVAGLLSDAMPEILAGHFDGDIARVFRRLIRNLRGHPLARRVLAGEEGAGAGRLTQLPAEARLVTGLAEALRRGQREGTVRTDIDPDLSAAGLESIVVALLLAILQTGDGAIDPTSSAGVVAVLGDAIRPPS